MPNYYSNCIYDLINLNNKIGIKAIMKKIIFYALYFVLSIIILGLLFDCILLCTTGIKNIFISISELLFIFVIAYILFRTIHKTIEILKNLFNKPIPISTIIKQDKNFIPLIICAVIEILLWIFWSTSLLLMLIFSDCFIFSDTDSLGILPIFLLLKIFYIIYLFSITKAISTIYTTLTINSFPKRNSIILITIIFFQIVSLLIIMSPNIINN